MADSEASIAVGVCLRRLPGCLRLTEVGLNPTDPAVNEREEPLDAAVGQFGQRDFWPLVAQNILTIKAWYPLWGSRTRPPVLTWASTRLARTR